MAQDVGLDFTYLSKIENGHEVPSDDSLARLAAYFDVSTESLQDLAGRVSPAVRAQAMRDERVGRLLRALPGLPEPELNEILRIAGVEEQDRA